MTTTATLSVSGLASNPNLPSNQAVANITAVQPVIFNKNATVTGLRFSISLDYANMNSHMDAVITDASGNVIVRSTNSGTISAPAANTFYWYYFPISATLTAGTKYYVGISSTDANGTPFPYVANDTSIAAGASRNSTSAGDGNYFTQYNELKTGSPGGTPINSAATAKGLWLVQIDLSIPNIAPNPATNQTLTGGTNGQNFNNASTLTFGWKATDPDGGNLVGYQVVGTKDDWVTWNYDSGDVACNIASGGSFSHSIAASSLVEAGNWRFNARVKDPSGVWAGWGAEFTAVVDKTAPTYSNPNVGATPTNAASGTTKNVSIDIADNLSGAYMYDAYYSNNNGSSWTQYLAQVTSSGATRTMPVPITVEGTYLVDFYVKDNAGNQLTPWPVRLSFVVDRTRPAAPSYTVGTKTMKTIPLSGISAFSDGAASSGFNVRTIFVDDAAGTTRIQTNTLGAVSSYTITGLTPGTTYRVGIEDQDKAGNVSITGTTAITTNAWPTATINNVPGSGYFNSQRPVLNVVGTDYNGSAVELRIIISKNANMSAPIVDTWASHSAEVGYAGWAVHGTVASGAVNTYTPQVDLGTGTNYVQVQAYTPIDGGNSGPLSAVMSFNVDSVAPSIGGITVTKYVNTTATVRMAISGVSDGGSGINRVDAYIQNAAKTAWSGPFTATNGGAGAWSYYFDASSEGDASHAVRFWVYDNAGNGTAIDSAIVYDTTAPVIASVQGYSYTNVKTGTRRVWAYGVTDNVSGINSMASTYIKPGGAQTGLATVQSGSDWYVDVPLDGVTEGEWSVQFQAADKAGNLSSVPTAYFFVDTVRANDPNPGATWGQTTADITWAGFSDPAPSSGYDHTSIWLGEIDAGGYFIGGAANIFDGLVLPNGTTEKLATGLVPGRRYQYTVANYDKAANMSAYTWRQFVTKKKIGESRINGAAGAISLPVYDPASGVVGSTALRTEATAGIGCFELVATTDPNASPVRVKTNASIQSISKYGGA